ncbi:MAG: BamA/TamA family outer membrane protein [Gemmatimonadetes bacterium]|nr:BamA/TamA family outer membrane protein [Gemmatimonadota bacterium]
MVTASRRDKVIALLVAVLLALTAPPHAAGQVPPDEAWRTLETRHFRVTFPSGLEDVGRLAADRAEAAWARLTDAFVEPPDGRVEILVTDHADVSNGFAGVVPFRRVTLFARPPVDGFALSYFHDWIDLVVTHELAHVLHLDMTGPLGRLLRGVFGRVPAPWPFFPQAGTPRWVVEGLATYYESALTPSGRVHGTYHEMVLRTALAEGRFEDLDEATGESPLWPGGSRPYVYGSLFLDWLLERHGPERMGRFADAVADQWIPYRLNAAARDAFGESFSDAWDAWRAELEAELDTTRARVAAGPSTPLETLTEGARQGARPSVSPDGRRLVYARADGRSDSQLRVAGLDGSGSRRLTRTNGVALFDWTPGGDIVFSQLEYADPYHLFADLWVVGSDGEVRRLTDGERLDHPSVAPDGRIVALRTEGGRAYLVEVDPNDGAVRTLTEPRLDRPWGFPAVSPDGRWIAAVRWERGAASDVVVLDRDGAEVARLTRDGALDLAPAWAPDGTLLWASDRTGIANLYAVAVDPGTGRPAGPVRQVTNVLTAVAFPSVDPLGRWIHLSEHHADGWEVARLPYEPSAWFEPLPADPRFGVRPVVAGAAPAASPPAAVEDRALEEDTAVRDYRPWSTLRPRFWEPLYREGVDVALPGGRRQEVLGPGFGFATSAADLVGRHALGAALTASTSGGRTDGFVTWAWAGLGSPVLAVTVDQSWDGAGPVLTSSGPDAPTDTLFLRERERRLSAGASFPVRRFRSFTGLSVTGGLVWERRELLDQALEPSRNYRLERPASRLADASATLSFSTARSHAFALGLEDGVAVSVRGRLRSVLDLPDTLSGVEGADRSFQEVVGRARGYHSFPVFGFSDHVVALRGSGGVAAGPGADPFHFEVGGSAGQAESFTGAALFGGRAYTFPVRGYVNGDRFGRTAWSVSGEYRFPLAMVNQGWGLLPLHIDRVAGAFFLDAGNAWGPEGSHPAFQNPRRSTLASAGAEVTVRSLTFFSILADVRTGVALPFADGRDPGLYLRLGTSF